jgi:hypothetical protein
VVDWWRGTLPLLGERTKEYLQNDFLSRKRQNKEMQIFLANNQAMSWAETREEG